MKIKTVKISKQKFTAGFTLIEFLIYLALTTVLLGLIVAIGFNVLSGGTKFNSIQDVKDNGNYAIQKISNMVGNAEKINGVSN
ncbi:MAG: prepilin-type N-terminal cleavage/methylation domain-containing protein [Minisyncoccia bacterium]